MIHSFSEDASGPGLSGGETAVAQMTPDVVRFILSWPEAGLDTSRGVKAGEPGSDGHLGQATFVRMLDA